MADELSTSQETLLGQYAGFVTRLVALIIDRLIISAIIFVLAWVAQFVLDLFGVNEWLRTGDLASAIVLGLGLLISALIYLGYDILFLVLAGQTPGKWLMGVRVVRTDGARLKGSNAVIRQLGYFVSAVLFLGYLWVLVDNKRQAWHDKLAGTLVIYSWPEEGGAPITDRLERIRQRRRASQGAEEKA